MGYGRAETWEDIEDILRSSYPDVSGRVFGVSLCAVDSGYKRDEVYDFCSENADICIPIKGKSTLQSRYIINRQEKETYDIDLYTINTDDFKNLLDSKIKRALRLKAKNELSTQNIISFHSQSDATLFEQYTSEYRIPVRNRGIEKFTWKKYKKDNHLWDCGTYNTFLAELLLHRKARRPEKMRENKKRPRQQKTQRTNHYIDNY
jgi:phage terminase large subunit GpA-like protein